MNQVALDLQPHTEYRIPLTKGQFALVDEDCFRELSMYNWTCQWNVFTKSFYAYRTVAIGAREIGRRKRTRLWMAKEVLKTDKIVDHRNHNTLDNRKDNLRIATSTQNRANARVQKNCKAGLKGAFFWKRHNNWKSTITINGKRKYLGTFATAEEAHAAYMKAHKELHGEFSYAGG